MANHESNFTPETASHNLEGQSLSEAVTKDIQVEQFITHFNVEDQTTQEALKKYPTLCYLLGNVTEEPQGRDIKFENKERDVFYLTEGSGMFGLEKEDDAMRWKGIFHHLIGKARQAYTVTNTMNSLTEEQIDAFVNKGYDRDSFNNLEPEFLKTFSLTDHGGRRQEDEHTWYNLTDSAHPEPHTSAENTIALLKNYNAHTALVDLMRVEQHDIYLKAQTEKGFFGEIPIAILTYTDWTFPNKPTTLPDFFEPRMNNPRFKPETLQVLWNAGQKFESDFIEIAGKDAIDTMINTTYPWEDEIRRAYCSASGIKPEETFPQYYEQFPQMKQPATQE